MARKKKQTLPAVQSGRLVQPLTKAQSKLLDALIDDPALSPADLCEVAKVPAYTWRRALRSPAFAAALMEAQRSALDASRLSRTQAAIEKAQTSPAFARLCFQIDGSIQEAPRCLVQQFNQQVNIPIAQLRKDYDAGATVQIPNLNFPSPSEVRQLPALPLKQDQQEQKGVVLQPAQSSDCPRFDDLKQPLTLPCLDLAPSEVLRGANHTPRCSEVGCAKSEVVEAQHYEVRSDTRYEVRDGHVVGHGIGQDAGSGPAGRAFMVSRAAPCVQGSSGRAEDDLFDLL